MGGLLVLLLQLASLVFLARAILSWFRIDRNSPAYPIARFVDQITEPVLAPVRRFLPSTGGFDFSVLVVLLLIGFVLIPIAARL